MTVVTATAPRLCACGCGHPTLPAQRTDRRYGNVRGQPLKYWADHGIRIKTAATCAKISAAKLGRKLSPAHIQLAVEGRFKIRPPKFSPYIPNTTLHWNKKMQRWFCRGLNGRGMLHARAVYEYTYGPISAGLHVHHRDGNCSRLEDDRPENLMLLTPIWNSRFLPTLATGFGVAENVVTRLYCELLEPFADRSDQELFAAICAELLKRRS